MTEPAPAERYRLAAAEAAGRMSDLESRSRRFSALRGLTFVGGSLALLLAPRLPGGPIAWWIGGAALLASFAALVARHRRLRARLARAEAAHALALEGSARVERRWADLPEPVPAPPAADDDHPYARDLDLYGRASLRSLMGPTATPMGRATLDAWLLGPAPASVLAERQEAVREVARRHALRDEAAVEARLLEPVDPETLRVFLEWVDEPPAIRGTSLDLVRRALPAATAVLVLLDLVDVLPPAGWVLALVLQAVIAWRSGSRLHPSFARASSGAPGLRRYHRLLAVWEAAAPRTPVLAGMVGRLAEGEGTASGALARLARLLDMADARLSGLLHPVLATGVLWDLHVAAGLDRWRADGARVRAWLEVLGDLEAIAAMGTLAADHPDWAWPEVEDPGPLVLRARALGHPLLPEAAGVRNDIEVGPPGTVLLVTGSNMSGKSTLLRSLGCAAVLARAGGPVCAERLTMPPVRVFTSMRVEDSLQEGVSLFMAELRRLRAILDAAAPARADEAEPLLYLVDEVLQGTNSEERRIAGRRLIRHLLRRRALGAVTTHDLELHRHPHIEPAAKLVHFREAVAADGPRGPALSFDYRLRPGLATTRNALLLAELTGLTDPDDESVGS